MNSVSKDDTSQCYVRGGALRNYHDLNTPREKSLVIWSCDYSVGTGDVRSFSRSSGEVVKSQGRYRFSPVQ